MQPYLPAPVVLGLCGAFAGLLGGGCNQCFPVWVGAATGGSLGCVLCLLQSFLIPDKSLPIAKPVSSVPVIIQNFHITYEITGQSKDITDPQKVIL